MSQKSIRESDKIIGSRIRSRRVTIGMSQEKLADFLNITFQQVQKYEKGTNRVSVSRLLEIARALNVEISYFYADLTAGSSSAEQLLTNKESINLVRSFNRISDAKVRRSIVDLVRSLSDAEDR